jgi:hypothetical protein
MSTSNVDISRQKGPFESMNLGAIGVLAGWPGRVGCPVKVE